MPQVNINELFSILNKFVAVKLLETQQDLGKNFERVIWRVRWKKVRAVVILAKKEHCENI